MKFVIARQDTKVLAFDEIIRTNGTSKAIVGIMIMALALRVWSCSRWACTGSISV
jgi:hypothetical protein